MALAATACAGAIAYAANVTPTPIVGPTETGENSLGAQQVTDMSRFKLGSGTITASGSGTSFTGTLNFASGQVTLNAATLGASGTAQATLTLTNSKAQSTNDFAFCALETFTGITAGAVPVCTANVTSAGTLTIQLADASATAMTSSTLVVNYMIITTGNPN